MKKLYLLLLTVFLNLAFFSCTPQALNEGGVSATEVDDCCDEDGEILPPPPGNGG